MKFNKQTRNKIEKIFQEIYEIDQTYQKGGQWNTCRRSELFQKLDKIYGVT